MIVALDPNVIIVALNHRGSLDLLLYLWDSNSYNLDHAVKIARDEEGIIRSEYNQYLGQRLQQGFKTLDVSFLTDLLSQWDTWTTVKAGNLNDRASRFLKDNGCVAKPEPQLIALATNSGVILGTVDPDITHRELQPRVIIQEPAKVHALCQRLPEFQVIYSSEAVAFLEYAFLSKLFESKVSEWTEKRYRNKYPRVEINRYLPYLKDATGAGEVDVLARDEESEPHRVLVCECKLRMPQKESKLVGEKEVSQLVTTWKVVKENEEQKAKKEGYNVRVFPMLVSNTEGITEQAWTLAQRHKVEIWRTILPENWHRHTNWEIDRCEQLRHPSQKRAN